jgi:CBS domain-containing protein
MKTAKDLLSNNLLHSNTINEDAMAIDALALMENKNVDYAIVTEGSNCVGIMSEVDYMHKIILARKNPKQTKVKDIMTNSICAVDINDPVHVCLGLMDTFKIRHLLVFDKFSFKGVITLHDLMHAAFEENVEPLLEQEQARYFISSEGRGYL